MVAFDNTILSLLIFPDADLRQGSEGQKVEHARERVAGLVQSVEDAREQVLVPTPVLCELLVTEGADVQDVLTTLRGSAYIRVESFDERAAVELAMRLRDARRAGASPYRVSPPREVLLSRTRWRSKSRCSERCFSRRRRSRR